MTRQNKKSRTRGNGYDSMQKTFAITSLQLFALVVKG